VGGLPQRACSCSPMARGDEVLDSHASSEQANFFVGVVRPTAAPAQILSNAYTNAVSIREQSAGTATPSTTALLHLQTPTEARGKVSFLGIPLEANAKTRHRRRDAARMRHMRSRPNYPRGDSPFLHSSLRLTRHHTDGCIYPMCGDSKKAKRVDQTLEQRHRKGARWD